MFHIFLSIIILFIDIPRNFIKWRSLVRRTGKACCNSHQIIGGYETIWNSLCCLDSLFYKLCTNICVLISTTKNITSSLRKFILCFFFYVPPIISAQVSPQIFSQVFSQVSSQVSSVSYTRNLFLRGNSFHIKPFFPNVLFLYLLKTLENRIG